MSSPGDMSEPADATAEATARLEQALERIATAAHTAAIARTVLPEPVAESAQTEQLVARLEALIEQVRHALAAHRPAIGGTSEPD